MSGPRVEPQAGSCYLCGRTENDPYAPQEWNYWNDAHVECEQRTCGPNIWSDRLDQRDGWAEE